MSNFVATKQKILMLMMSVALGILLLMWVGFMTTRKVRREAQQTQMELLLEIRNDVKELKEWKKEQK